MVEYHRVEERLRDLGFLNDTREGAPICRWLGPGGHVLDLMPVDETVLGFSNRWYPAAAHGTEECRLKEGLLISIPRPAVFLATKLAAFLGRGGDDLLGSSDLEDVITLVAGRPEIVAEVRKEPAELRIWLSEVIRELLASGDFPIALQGALPDAAAQPAYRRTVHDRFDALSRIE